MHTLMDDDDADDDGGGGDGRGGPDVVINVTITTLSM